MDVLFLFSQKTFTDLSLNKWSETDVTSTYPPWQTIKQLNTILWSFIVAEKCFQKSDLYLVFKLKKCCILSKKLLFYSETNCKDNCFKAPWVEGVGLDEDDN